MDPHIKMLNMEELVPFLICLVVARGGERCSSPHHTHQYLRQVGKLAPCHKSERAIPAPDQLQHSVGGGVGEPKL